MWTFAGPRRKAQKHRRQFNATTHSTRQKPPAGSSTGRFPSRRRRLRNKQSHQNLRFLLLTFVPFSASFNFGAFFGGFPTNHPFFYSIVLFSVGLCGRLHLGTFTRFADIPKYAKQREEKKRCDLHTQVACAILCVLLRAKNTPVYCTLSLVSLPLRHSTTVHPVRAPWEKGFESDRQFSGYRKPQSNWNDVKAVLG